VSELDTAALLVEHRPVMQYDSLESYLTDWAAVITDRPGNVLKQADGTVIAVAGSAQGIPELNLAFLQPATYPSGQAVAATDYLSEGGADYVSAAREMHARPGYANKAHGRAVEQNGVTWLQYWLFSYYDDPGFLGFGTHEGDIEMIQIRLDAQGQPDAVSYSQHRSGVSAAWADVETDGTSPVVFCGRGSHASMLRSGTLHSGRSLLADHNDGAGPRLMLDLVDLSPAQTPWAYWPGHWGGTVPESVILGKVGVEATSPASLVSRQSWSDPAGFHAACQEVALPPVGAPMPLTATPPPAPALDVHVDEARNVARISYSLPDNAETPASMVIGVDASGGALPPATMAVPMSARRGEVEAPLSPGQTAVDVRATAHSEEGAVSATASARSGPS
jgi:hypothetical protein